MQNSGNTLDYKTKLYNTWRGMKNRCHSPNPSQPAFYKDKGIKVCDEWIKWANFKIWALSNGYKDGLTIDRIDNSKGYQPNNCRFVTQEQNCNNRSITIIVIYNGVFHPLKPLLRSIGKIKCYRAIRDRIARGWNHEEAINTPIKVGLYNYGNRWKS